MEPHRLALPVGFQIEHFRVEAVLGKGGFGITYLAVDLQLGKRVAIKELLPDTIATRVDGLTVVPHSVGMQENWEWARERFLEEARTLATFSHPAIVGVHRLIEANGTVYMVMDYVEGESYEARLQRIGTEPDQKSLMAVMAPILSGLEEVHSHGLLHRDIKPENILIDKRGQPVLIDFGSARESVGKTMTMTSIVTHGYSPIEQYQTRGKMGPWTDIYAIAAVMRRAIAGEKPPVASDRVLDDSYESLVIRVSSDFSHEFYLAVDQALKVRPEARPQSIMEWKQQLTVDPDSGKRWTEEATPTESRSLKVQCPHCSQHVELDSSMSKTLICCPNCNENFRASHNEYGAGQEVPTESRPFRPNTRWAIVAGTLAACLLVGAAVSRLLIPSDPAEIRENGRKLFVGEGSKKDTSRGIKLLREASDKGDVEAHLLLGEIYSRNHEGGPSRDLEASLEMFNRAAKANKPTAHVELGWRAGEGLGRIRDFSAAAEHYGKAAEGGDAVGKYNYALLLLIGYGVAKDQSRAESILDSLTESEKETIFLWYKNKAEAGYYSAQSHLAGMFEEGFGVAADHKQAVLWRGASLDGLERAAEEGDKYAHAWLGDHYLTRHPEDALEWYRKAAEQGLAEAQDTLGFMHAEGRGVTKDEAEAVKWYRKAADQGLAIAQWNLGTMYEQGRGVAKNDTEAVKWYRKAADQGLAVGQAALGLMLLQGHGVTKSDVEAVEWFRKAAEQGFAAAENYLGSMYAEGIGVTKDQPKALEWYLRAAEQGNAEAQTNLGRMYAQGRGVTKDEAQAVEWYRKAAEQEDVGAQCLLGTMYEGGLGVKKNPVKAVEWYRKAAEQGNAVGQLLLGTMYAQGRGVPSDESKAVEWYRKAADQGLAGGQLLLGTMYAHGRGLTKDEEKAAQWYSKAAEQGDQQAKDLLLQLESGGRNSTPDPTTGLAAIDQKLDRTIIPRISLTDATVRETVEFLERQSAINDPNPGLGGGKGIKIALTLDSHSASQTLTMDLTNIPLREALDYLGRLSDLKVTVNAQEVSISPLRNSTQSTDPAKVKYGIPVAGTPGFVTSPYTPNAGFIDVRGFPPGTEVKDPYTDRPFLVP